MPNKIYLAGPMSGYPQYNQQAFEHTAARLRADGFDVTTPFELNDLVWHRHFGRAFDPATDTCDWGNPILREMFAEDIRVLSESDKVVFLNGWKRSKGARLEYTTARQLGIPCERLDGSLIEDPVAIVLSEDPALDNVVVK